MTALVPVTAINFALYASQDGGISSFKTALDWPLIQLPEVWCGGQARPWSGLSRNADLSPTLRIA